MRNDRVFRQFIRSRRGENLMVGFSSKHPGCVCVKMFASGGETKMEISYRQARKLARLIEHALRSKRKRAGEPPDFEHLNFHRSALSF
jgi:hypothetical protein